jgi:hypothetical protein
MKTRFIALLLFAAGILFTLPACETKAEKCFTEFKKCYDEVDAARRKNSTDAEACRRAALDAQRDGLKNCQELPDAAARETCFARITAVCDQELKKCNDDYDKNNADLQKRMDECFKKWKTCMGN